MSINRMDWSRNSNGAVAHSNNQQYLQQPTSSTASTMPNQTAYGPPNLCPPAQNNRFLKSLLGATSSEEILQIQQSALAGRQKSTAPVQQTTLVSSSGQYNTSCSLRQIMSNATNQQSSRNAQNPVLQNFQVQTYPVTFLQTFQQSSCQPVGQQKALSMSGVQQQQALSMSGVQQQQALSMSGVQQQQQALSMSVVQQQQALSMSGVQQQQALSMSGVQQQQQALSMSGVQQQQQALSMSGVQQQQAHSLPGVQQQAHSLPGIQQQAHSLPGVQQQAQPVLYYTANGYNSREVQQPHSHKKTSQQMLHSYPTKKPSRNTQRNFQTMMPNIFTPVLYSIQNGNANQTVVPYKATNDKNVPVLTTNSQNGQNIQMGSNFQTVPLANTLQCQGSMNDYGQSSQGQMMPNYSTGFANTSSPNVLPSATIGQMPPPYPQSNTNATNVYVNQSFSNPSQNFGEQNVQQSYTVTQDQHSVTMPPLLHGGNVPQDQRNNNMQEILALLKIYQSIKHKYLLLNRENNLLRQKMQNSSQNNSGSTVKPPLISTLPDKTAPTNNPMGAQEVPQNSIAQNQSPVTHDVQTPTLYDSLNVNAQNITHQSNSFPNFVHPTNNVNVLSQRNYTGLETGQMNPGSKSSGQAVVSETLQGHDPQITSMMPVPSDNQYLSTGNSKHRNMSQDGLPISSESCNPDQTMDSSNLYTKKLLTSISRDVIKVTLPLWKSVPSETEPKLGVNSSHDALHLLEEMASGVSQKGIEPQIAIVPPLVQIKELVNELDQIPKAIPQGEDMANNEVNGLKENDCLGDILLAVESVDAKSNLDNIQPRSNMVSSSPSSVQVSSSCSVDQNATKNCESVDYGLQISGICTLVEGNTFYDSSIAMMFEGSLQTQSSLPLMETEAKDHQSVESTKIYNVSHANALSPTTESMANKTDLQGEFETSVNFKDDQQGTNVCLEMQPGQDLADSDRFGLVSDNVSDQLSKLLKEFPFGIKNYMAEKTPESPKVSLQRIPPKNEIPNSLAPLSYELERDGSIEEFRIKYKIEKSADEELLTEYVMDRSTNESKTEYGVDGSANEESKTEYTMDTSTKEMDPQKTEVKGKRELTPELPINELSVQLEDDFEICESPDGNICITLLDKDQITEIFPEDHSAKLLAHDDSSDDRFKKPFEASVHDEESPDDSFEKPFEATVVDVSASSIKEEPDNDTTPNPDKGLFCCLFSWLTHTNGNAPKCNCKPIEMEEFEGLDICSNAEELNSDTSTAVLEPMTAGFEPSLTEHCKIKSDEVKKAEFLPHVNKYPKFEPVLVSSEGKSSPREKHSKLHFSEKPSKENESLKEMKHSSANQKILQPRSYLEGHNSKKVKDLFSGSKSKVDGRWKLEKLVVKTDFLKNKHLLKMKRKYKEKTSRVEEGGARSVQKINTEVGESAKALIIERIFGSKAKNEKSKSSASTTQQSGRSMDKIRSFGSSDKSPSHGQVPAVRKRKERHKSRTESHFEKVKKVPTVQEYLERKRELCNKRSGSRVDQRDELPQIKHKVVEKPSMERSENNSPPKLLGPLSPVKINIKTKYLESEAIRQAQKGQPKSNTAYESAHKKHRTSSRSHEKESSMKKKRDHKIGSGKEKIYLTPCEGTKLNSYEGISLTKLQIRCSPEKPGYFERRKSLDEYVHNKPSKSETKNEDAPKMLEFKLCPEFVNRSPSTQEKKGEPKAAKERNIIEGIKSKKEAWCIGVPFKKRKLNITSEDQGHLSPPPSTSSHKSTQKHSSRPVQDTQTTFNVFKQLYQEQRSKSLDSGL